MLSNTLVKKSPLVFFLLVFILALPFWLLGFLVKTHGLPMDLPVSSLQFVCPLIAAVILVSREKQPGGVRRLFKRIFAGSRMKHLIWYVPILFLLPFIYLLSYGVMCLMGRPLPDPSLSWSTIPLLFVVFLLPAACEEAGWMGYVIDPMQERWGAGTASLMLGAAWGLWHAVPWLQIHPWPWVAWQCFADLGTRLLIVWLYNNTGKIVVAAILFHDMDNVGNSVFPNNGSHYDPAVTGTIIAIAAVTVTFFWGSKTLARFRYAHQQTSREDECVAHLQQSNGNGLSE